MADKRKIRIAAFALPICLCLIVMIMLNAYPFGDNTVLVHDMFAQYQTYFLHLGDILHGRASAFYTFSLAYGGDMIGVAAYYLISPFNLIFYFADTDNIIALITIVFLLKTGVSGWTMCCYLNEKTNGAANLIFSTAYALSAYCIAYNTNIMWLDGVIILPVMVLGIERLTDRGSFLMYLLSLAYGVITNFYIGYMLCIFSVIYFLCYFIFLTDTPLHIGTIIKYALSSLLGGMLCAVVLLPELYLLSGGRASTDTAVLVDWSVICSLPGLIRNLLACSIRGNQIISDYPVLYCSVLVPMLAACYFLQRRSVRKKAGYAILLAVMLVSMMFESPYLLWHGLNNPNGSPYRFAFITIFVIIMIAHETAAEITLQDDMDYSVNGQQAARHMIIYALPGIALMVFLIGLRRLYRQSGNMAMLAINAALIIVYTVIIIFGCQVRAAHIRENCANAVSKNTLQIIALFVVCAEITMTALSYYSGSDIYASCETASSYRQLTGDISYLVDEIKADDSFYRTVIKDSAAMTNNDGFIYNIYDLDSYTSMEQMVLQKAASALGYSSHSILGIHYGTGSTYAAEVLLGVKYMISQNEAVTGYHAIDSKDGYMLFENELALPLALPAKSTITAVNDKDGDIFDYQNAIFKELSDIDDAIFSRIQLSSLDVNGDTDVPGFTVEEGGEYYMQFLGDATYSFEAFVNGEWINPGEIMVWRLGSLAQGDKVTIYSSSDEAKAALQDNLVIYREDMDVLTRYANDILAKGVTVDKISESHIMVQYNNTSDDGYLLLTTPYYGGWHVKVDGVDTAYTGSLYAFMTIPIENGQHTVELTYIPHGLKKGAAISAMALFILIIWVLIDRRSKT